MGRRKRQVVPLSGDGRRLEALIDIILRCHPMSLRILAGEYEPTTDELSEILECLSRGDIDIPRGAVGFCGSSEEEVRVIRAEAFGGVLGKIGGVGVGRKERVCVTPHGQNKTRPVFEYGRVLLEGEGSKDDTTGGQGQHGDLPGICR